MLHYCQSRLRVVLGLFSIGKVQKLSGRKGLYQLGLILVVITLSVIAATIIILYRISLSVERDQLFEIAKSQARLIEAVARYNLDDYNNFYIHRGHNEPRDSNDVVEWATEATMSQLIDAHSRVRGFGNTGEFTIAKLEDSSIVFLLSQRLHNNTIPPPISFGSGKADPMRRALSGQSGTITALDYRGVEVLAGYEPVENLKIGIVAKIDIAELRTPFILTGIVAGVIGLLLIGAGILLIYWVTSPLIRQLEESKKRLHMAFEGADLGIRDWDIESDVETIIDKVTSPLVRRLEESEERLYLAIKGADLGIWDWNLKSDIVTINDSWLMMIGYTRKEIGASLAQRMKMIHPDDRARMQYALNKHLSGKTIAFECEYRMKSKTVDWVWILDKGKVVLKSSDGSPLRMTGTYIDITARKRGEWEMEELNRSLHQIAAFATNNPGPVLRSNTQGIICVTNPASYSIFGRDVTGESLNDVFPGNESVFDGIMSEGAPLQFELKMGTRTFLFAVRRDESISSTYLYGIEISKRKQAEEELRKLSQAVEQSPSSVVITDLQGNIEFVNQSFFEMTGYSASEVLGKNRYSMNQKMMKKTKQIYRDMQKALRAGKTWSGEYFNTRENGESYWISATVGPMKNEQNVTTHYLAIEEDITERKRAEEELRKLFQAVEQSPVSMVITDLKGHIEYVNPKFEQLTGYSACDVIGKNPRIWKSGKESKETYQEMWDTITQGGTWTGEIQNKKKNGELYWEAATICPLIGDDGDATHYLGVKEDITERRRLEYELAVVQKLESIGVLAGGIAHDFNNILTAILGNVSVAKLKTEQGTLMRELLDEAEKASHRAKALTNQLLTFSKGGAPVLKSTSIAYVIKESVQFALRGSTVGSDISIDDNLLPTHIDENQISQVITNLVINARQAMSESGYIEIKCDNYEITDSSSLPLKPGKYITVSIRDMGTGISSEHLERIFDPYFTTKQTGSGLGLATSFSIAKKHGGFLFAESTVGEGSTFTLYLPASFSQPVTPAEKDDEIVKGSGRILLMDDEEAVRKVLSGMLDVLGYEVEVTSDGKEALEKFKNAQRQNRPFDAVILDMTVPGGMGGKETLEKLLEIKPKVKAIVSTGYSDDSVIAQYEKYGFCGQIPKPYNIHELSEVLQSIMSAEVTQS